MSFPSPASITAYLSEDSPAAATTNPATRCAKPKGSAHEPLPLAEAGDTGGGTALGMGVVRRRVLRGSQSTLSSQKGPGTRAPVAVPDLERKLFVAREVAVQGAGFKAPQLRELLCSAGTTVETRRLEKMEWDRESRRR